jgi:aspartyl protease family protein
VLERNRYGHYHARGQINGRDVEFLLDTGATEVSVPAVVANRLRLRKGAEMQVNTANGILIVYAARLERVQLGNIVLHNVKAHINPGIKTDEVLLGMSFLKQLEFSQRGNTLTLVQPKQ